MRAWQRLFLGGIFALAISCPVAALPQNDGPDKQKAAARSAGLKGRKAAVTRPAGRRASQSDSTSLAVEEAAVVKVRVRRADGNDDTATGLFVGSDSKNAYFITALHAISEDPDSLDVVLVHNIQIQFRHSQRFPAFPETKIDQVLDLGVVRTAAANLPRNLPKIPRKDVAVGVQFHIMGNPAGDWSVWSGNVEKDAVGDEPRLFRTNSDNSLAGGFSGGPVFDYDGAFLGMHTGTKTSYGIAAKSGPIVDRLNAWGIPTDNFTAQPQPPPTAPPPVSSVSQEEADTRAIDRVLNAYETAYNRKDAEALWKIWPSAPSATKQAIERYFTIAKAVTMRVTDRRIEPSGMSATADAQFAQEFIPKMGSQQKSSGSISFNLEKRAGTWEIVSVK